MPETLENVSYLHAKFLNHFLYTSLLLMGGETLE